MNPGPRLHLPGPILSLRSQVQNPLPENGRPKTTAIQELRELLENSPQGRRAMRYVEVQPQTHGGT